MAHLFSFYEGLAYEDTCCGLLAGGRLFDKTPDGWLKEGEPRFGPCRHRAWTSSAGGGRIFEGSWQANPAAVAVQEAVRPLIAGMLSCDPDTLVRIDERVSVKPAGSKELRPHLDGNRVGSYQVVIALSQTHFQVFPGSHSVAMDRYQMATKYYELTKVDMEDLKERGVSKQDIPAKPGDVLVMLGGRVAHSSPAVEQGAQTRYMAYAHYEQKAP